MVTTCSTTAAPVLDRRLHAYRDDLADDRLRGRVTASRFAAGEVFQIVTGCVPVHRAPRFDALLDTQALLGERLRVFERAEGWAWVQLEADGYVGYVPDNAMVPDPRPVTHRVTSLGTFVYATPDIKSQVLQSLGTNAGLSSIETRGAFLHLATSGYVVDRHTAPVDVAARDFVAVAERFAGAPYLWGGKTGAGLDCSGLVQTALQAAGLDCPRDSDMQRAALGDAVEIDAELSGLRRGDLLFWPGHVGIMTGAANVLHANAFHMEVAIEPVREAVARIAQSGSVLLAVKRLARPTGV